MSDHIYKTVEITGSSSEGLQDAVEQAVGRASATLHNLRWFEVTDIRGQLDGKGIDHWQVTMKIGFTLDGNEGA